MIELLGVKALKSDKVYVERELSGLSVLKLLTVVNALFAAVLPVLYTGRGTAMVLQLNGPFAGQSMIAFYFLAQSAVLLAVVVLAIVDRAGLDVLTLGWLVAAILFGEALVGLATAAGDLALLAPLAMVWAQVAACRAVRVRGTVQSPLRSREP